MRTRTSSFHWIVATKTLPLIQLLQFALRSSGLTGIGAAGREDEEERVDQIRSGISEKATNWAEPGWRASPHNEELK